ncbi:MAG: GNAT family N-acetyltransferase, partial [Longimicrobiales bacterium]
MISRCVAADAQRILEVINSAAIAYRDVIPNDCWHDPYMSIDELHSELESGVVFIGHREEGRLMGVMGSQD